MVDKRQNFSTGSHYEKLLGHSRAVKVGATVYVSGTVGLNYATGAFPEDPVEQIRNIGDTIARVLGEAGSGMQDIVQITTYVSAPQVFEAITPELKRIFGDAGPTNTGIVVGFPFAEVKVEISAIAVIGCGG